MFIVEHRLIDDAAPACAGLLLASASARRRELLRQAGVEFQTEIAQVEELTGPRIFLRGSFVCGMRSSRQLK